MSFLKMLRKKKSVALKGEALIQNVTNKFSNMICQLHEAADDCCDEQVMVEGKIAVLSARSASLVKSANDGRNLAQKLTDLVG